MGSIGNILPTVLESDEDITKNNDFTCALLPPMDESPNNGRYLVTKKGRFTHLIKRKWVEIFENKLLFYNNNNDNDCEDVLSLNEATFRSHIRPYKTCHEHLDPHPFLSSGYTTRSRYCTEIHSPFHPSGIIVIHCHGGGAEGSNDLLLQQLYKATGIPVESDSSIPPLIDFVQIKPIGVGGFGKVFLVRQKSTGELFALKQLEKSKIKTQAEKEQMLTEKEILIKIDHPFIIKLYHCFQSATKLCYIIEYCSGGELYYHLQHKGKFMLQETLFYLAELILAFGKLHENDIIYRDVKPENILIHSDGHIRLTDFGLSKQNVSWKDTTTSICGSPEYIAPEVIMNKPYNNTVDWWGLGCLAYELQTGASPFYCGPNQLGVFERIKAGNINYPIDMDIDMIIFLKQLLVKDSEERLGFGTSGLTNIQNSRIFSKYGINWDDVYHKRLVPPIIPEFKTMYDTPYVDSKVTEIDVHQNPYSINHINSFQDFSYTKNIPTD